ncbi:MAG TPA: hypothetical protein DCM59_15720 [Clostridium sp.]|nr:hypothetical protein [Clostridium sp.]
MFFKVNLIDHIPEFLREIREFHQIMATGSVELNKLTEAMKQNLENSFLETMDELGISRYEKFLEIIPQGTLEQRRKYILALIRNNDKLSEKTIKAIVATIMDAGCFVRFHAGGEPSNPNPGQGTLVVRVLAPDASSTDYRFENVARMILPLMPAHIKLEVHKFFTTWDDIQLKHNSWNDIKNSFASWQEVKDYLPPI